MTIALFGGRFDPVHNGHVAIAKEALKVKAADEIWFSLENQHQWRPIVASVNDRMQMLKLAIEETTPVIPAKAGIQTWIPGQARDDIFNVKFKIDDTPIRLGGLTETISVVRDLRKKIPHEIVFLAGSDQLPTFPKWTNWEDLQKEVQFLIVARKGSPIENIPSNCRILEDPNFEPLEDSATRIRNFIKEGKSIHGLVPEKVEEYIISHGLYKR